MKRGPLFYFLHGLSIGIGTGVAGMALYVCHLAVSK